MISGIISSALEAIVSIVVRGPEGKEKVVDAAVDSGFNGWLSLPLSIIQELGCSWETLDEGILADGREVMFDVFTVIVNWNGEDRRLFVHATIRTALIGMSLLEGHEVNMKVWPGGEVAITPRE